MNALRIAIALTAAIATTAIAHGQDIAAADTISILEAINRGEGSTVTIVQPRQLDSRILTAGEVEAEAATERQATTAGYRVQVFADNNVNTAKAQAESRKHAIAQRFPGTRAYLSFESPYWRVRVGDFRTRAQAQSFMEEVRNAFPNFAAELRIVREKINNVAAQ